MGGLRSGPAGAVAAALAAAGAVLAGALTPAYADGTVAVQGTAFPTPTQATLSFVGCADLYQRTDEGLVPMIGVRPRRGTPGTRSMGWDLAGGNAVGVMFSVGSVALGVDGQHGRALGRTSHRSGLRRLPGAGRRRDDAAVARPLGDGHARRGLATFEAATRVYTWTKYDMASRRAVDAGPGGGDDRGRVRRGSWR